MPLTAGEAKDRLGSNRRKLLNMLTHSSQAVPEIRGSNVKKAAAYYVNALGFHLDWYNDQEAYDFNWELRQEKA
jgi:hypothetical protein